MFLVLGSKKLELAALGANENINFKRTGKEVRKIAQDPAGFAELNAFVREELHRFTASKTA